MKAPSKWKVKVSVEIKPVVDSLMFKLHYRWTYLLFVLSAALATLYDAIGKKIDCLVQKDYDTSIQKDKSFTPFKDAVDQYCFVTGTFTVGDTRYYNTSLSGLPHPAVGPASTSGKEAAGVTVHSYYQWVPFVLFLQGVMFYVPHYLWKRCEGGEFREIVRDISIRDYLGDNLHNYFSRQERLETLSKYVRHTIDHHKAWAYKFFVCEALNLAVVVATLLFTDWFLGGAFLSYGINVFEASGQDPELRVDPMSLAFPKVAKCTFKLIGPSGTVQLVDNICVIATNIVNEKIYLVLWVWLVFLTTCTSIGLFLRLLTLLLPGLRHLILKTYTKESSRGHLKALLNHSPVSDWFLLLSFAKNMEQSVFSELVTCLHTELLPAPPAFLYAKEDFEGPMERAIES